MNEHAHARSTNYAFLCSAHQNGVQKQAFTHDRYMASFRNIDGGGKLGEKQVLNSAIRI